MQSVSMVRALLILFSSFPSFLFLFFFSSLLVLYRFMIMGQSGGVAAAQAIKEGKGVQDIDINTLQVRLASLGQLLTNL